VVKRSPVLDPHTPTLLFQGGSIDVKNRTLTLAPAPLGFIFGFITIAEALD